MTTTLVASALLKILDFLSFCVRELTDTSSARQLYLAALLKEPNNRTVVKQHNSMKLMSNLSHRARLCI